MKKLVVMVVFSVGFLLVAQEGAAEAQRFKVRSHSKGVSMKCRAGSKSCTFKNSRGKPMRCTYTVSFVVRKRGVRERKSKSGSVFMTRHGVTSRTFYHGRRRVKRMISGSLYCKGRRHHRGRRRH